MAVDELRFRTMASDAQVIVVDGPPEATISARRDLELLESLWSRFVESSDISRLNQADGRPVRVDPSTLTLIDVMIEAASITNGRYDPTTLPALIAAGYTTSIEGVGERTTTPDDDHLAIAPPSTLGRTRVDHDGWTVQLAPGIAIDPGGIGKGLAADLVVAGLLGRGAAGALVSIGGDLAAAGSTPTADGWALDIEDPLDPPAALARVLLSGGGVATSSTQSRRWTQGSTERHHVIDPHTHAPSLTDLAAVTVIASCGWQAEAHATALLLGGSAGFVRYAEAHRIEAVATTGAGVVMMTDALAPLIPSAVS